MLLPDNIHPELSIYYNGALIMQELEMEPQMQMIDLYAILKEKSNMTFAIYVSSLDWLYLMQLAEVNEGGIVEKCL